MQNVFNCLDELKRFKEIPPNTIVIEDRNGKTVTWQQIPSEQTDGYDTGANYLVSDQGDSYSIHRHSCMKNHDNGNGYVGINLRYGGETHRKKALVTQSGIHLHRRKKEYIIGWKPGCR